MDEPLERPPRYSMSFLRTAHDCVRKAVYDRDANTSSPAAAIGRAFHDAAAAIGEATVLAGSTKPDPAHAHTFAQRALAKAEEVLPLTTADHDEVMSLVDRWTATVEFPEGSLFEVFSEQEAQGQRYSARLDVLAHDSDVAQVIDWKTGRALPGAAESNIQGMVYLWHTQHLVPETVERFEYVEHYVRFSHTTEPLIVERGSDELTQIQEWLDLQSDSLTSAYERQDFPATPGAHCAFCPVSVTCPVPSQVRVENDLTDDETATEFFEALLVEQANVDRRKKALRAYLEGSGGEALVAGGKRIGFTTKPSKRLDNKLAAAAGVDLDEFRVEKMATTFGITKDKGGE